jgi:hypothetical protein
MEYKGYEVQIEVSPSPYGAGLRAAYRCYRDSELIYYGTVIGGLETVEDAECEALKTACRRIDQRG